MENCKSNLLKRIYCVNPLHFYFSVFPHKINYSPSKLKTPNLIANRTKMKYFPLIPFE